LGGGLIGRGMGSKKKRRGKEGAVILMQASLSKEGENVKRADLGKPGGGERSPGSFPWVRGEVNGGGRF